eukprot:7476504-Pyramimonas_sp.AAC.1
MSILKSDLMPPSFLMTLQKPLRRRCNSRWHRCHNPLTPPHAQPPARVGRGEGGGRGIGVSAVHLLGPVFFRPAAFQPHSTRPSGVASTFQYRLTDPDPHPRPHLEPHCLTTSVGAMPFETRREQPISPSRGVALLSSGFEVHIPNWGGETVVLELWMGMGMGVG